MSGLAPDNPEVEAWYWLRAANTDVAAVWVPSLRKWGQLTDGAMISAEEAALNGWVWATTNGVECRHPIPGPAALMRMHALAKELDEEAELFRPSGVRDIYARGKGHAFADAAAMLKEAMKG